MNTRDSKTKLLLKYMAFGGAIVVLSLANPVLPHYLIKAYFKNKKFQKAQFLRDLKRLQSRELVDYQELPDGQVKMTLKSNSKKIMLKYDIDTMKLGKPRSWDKKWRLIIFDIPNKKRAASGAFSGKLKDLGFYKLQKSVYLHPFPCEKEIEFITSIFNIREHILILNISDFEGEKKLKYHFGLK